MKVVLLYNSVSEDTTVAESDVLRQRDAVANTLLRLGHDVAPIACTLDLAAVKSQFDRLQPDLAFNLVESLAGTDRLMPLATLLMDAIDLPYTGAPTRSILATTNKLAAKASLEKAGLPTAPWIADSPQPFDPAAANDPASASRRARAILNSGSRAIVKAVWEHASFRMDDDAVVMFTSEPDAYRVLQSRRSATGRPHFAEQFIDGREFNLTILAAPGGPEVLPPAEIDFASYPTDKPRIVGYRAKWDEESFEYVHTPRRFDYPPSDAPLLRNMSDLAIRCWHLFEMRGYARVDFRVDSAGHPWILEVNANPCLAPDAGFAASVERAEIGFDEAVRRILDDSLPAGERVKEPRSINQQPPSDHGKRR